MIKIIPLLTESFTTYKKNFKKIFWIVLPVLFLTIVGGYYIKIFEDMVGAEDYSNISYLLTTFTVYFVCVLIVSLYFGPVLNRVIQKKEDGEKLDSQSAYDFQKKNIFKWIMINVWGMLYMIWRLLPYIISAIILGYIAYFFNSFGLKPEIFEVVFLLIIPITALILGIVMNITRFMLYKNIYFSKDHIKARDAIRESVKIGVHKQRQVWLLISSLMVLVILMLIMYSLLGFIIVFLSNLVPSMGSNIENVLTACVSVLFFLPLMSIVTAKGYVKIRG